MTQYPTPRLRQDIIARWSHFIFHRLWKEELIRVTAFSEISSFASSSTTSTIILDARNTESFEAGHIPHSFSLPWRITLDEVPSQSSPSGFYYRLPSIADFERKISGHLGEDKTKIILSDEQDRPRRIIHCMYAALRLLG